MRSWCAECRRVDAEKKDADKAHELHCTGGEKSSNVFGVFFFPSFNVNVPPGRGPIPGNPKPPLGGGRPGTLPPASRASSWRRKEGFGSVFKVTTSRDTERAIPGREKGREGKKSTQEDPNSCVHAATLHAIFAVHA